MKEHKYEDVGRIMYFWKKHSGTDEKPKVWKQSDLNLLEKRLEAYFKNPDKFSYDYPVMGYDK